MGHWVYAVTGFKSQFMFLGSEQPARKKERKKVVSERRFSYTGLRCLCASQNRQSQFVLSQVVLMNRCRVQSKYTTSFIRSLDEDLQGQIRLWTLARSLGTGAGWRADQASAPDRMRAVSNVLIVERWSCSTAARRLTQILDWCVFFRSRAAKRYTQILDWCVFFSLELLKDQLEF